MAQGSQPKQPDAMCPMCGSPLKNSPAGKVHLKMLEGVAKQLKGGSTPRPARMGMQPMRPSPGRGY